MRLSAGSRLGVYEVVSLVGAGGMGEVYRARDTRLERTVAIKVLNSSLTATPELKARFEREAKVISQLQHPNICVLHDIGSENGTDFLVMEFLEGDSLADRLRQGPLPTNELLKIAIQIADALDKAHRAGIVHRDLKPGNVMLTKSGAKLLDFGLAKPVNAAASAAPSGGSPSILSSFNAAPTRTSPSPLASPLTMQGTVVGTIQYTSPEQIEGKEADGRSDIFSFGGVLYEMATGRRAFQGKSPASVIGQILALDPPPPSSVRPEITPTLDRVVRICLDKDPDQRFQNVHDLKLQLQIVAEAPVAAAGPGIGRVRNRERIAWAAALLLLVLAIASSIGYVLRAPQPKPSIVSEIPVPTSLSWEPTGNFSDPPALSPDGKQLAFGGRPAYGTTEFNHDPLWIRPLGSQAARPLAGTGGATFPFWSPDGRYLGYFAHRKLIRINSAGGAPIEICDVSDHSEGGAWSGSGTILFGGPDGIYRVPVAGGKPQAVTTLNSSRHESAHVWPQFLPDDEHFLFYVRSAEGNAGIYAASLQGGEPRLILRGDSDAIYAAPGYLLFVRQGILMAQPFDADQLRTTGEAVPVAENAGANLAIGRGIFTVSDSGVLAFSAAAQSTVNSALSWFDRNGKQTGETGPPAQYVQPSLSPDGGRLAIVILDPLTQQPGVWVYDLTRGTRTRLTFYPGINAEPAWSPDGKMIAFNSNRRGSLNIYEKAADGTGSATPLVVDDANDYFPTWSHDSRYVVFQRAASRSPIGIWAVPASGEGKAFPIIQDKQFGSGNPALSPSGKWLAYVSDESGRQEVYVVPFPQGKGKWLVSIDGGTEPEWRSDGNEIFYLSPDKKLMAAQVSQHGGTLSVGRVETLFQAHPSGLARNYAVSADGRKFLVVTAGTERTYASLTLVTNWSGELKK